MKPGNSLITLVMMTFALVISIYLGVYAFNTFHEPYTTTYAYDYVHPDSVQVNGVLVRAEQVLTGGSGIIELQCGEGEKVSLAQTVAHVYRDAQAQEDSAKLEQLSGEISVLQAALATGGGVDSVAQMDEDILQSVVELRALVAGREMGELEQGVRDVKSLVIRRGITYGEGITPQQVRDRLSELAADYQQRSSLVMGAHSKVRAPISGTFSAITDGLESVLTPESVKTLTPSALDDLINVGATRNLGLGKLITRNRWYFAANVSTQVAQAMKVGDSRQVRFTGDFDQSVQMQVVSIGEPEGDRVTVVFSTDRFLGQTTSLRFQSAELVFKTYSGLRIPKAALHMRKYTVTDKETGEEREEQEVGVYTLVAGRAEFKPVRVETTTSDYYVVNGTSDAAADAFHDGDEVIVHAVGLYDGKLMQ